MDKQMDLTLNSLGVSEPYSMEAEQAILGAAIISPETVSLIIEQVKAEYFYSRQNQKIFLEIHKLFNANIQHGFKHNLKHGFVIFFCCTNIAI